MEFGLKRSSLSLHSRSANSIYTLNKPYASRICDDESPIMLYMPALASMGCCLCLRFVHSSIFPVHLVQTIQATTRPQLFAHIARNILSDSLLETSGFTTPPITQNKPLASVLTAQKAFSAVHQSRRFQLHLRTPRFTPITTTQQTTSKELIQSNHGCHFEQL